MEFAKTSLDGLFVISPKVFNDSRGFFYESFKQSLFEQNGIKNVFIQDNHSKSSLGVLRGLHYQLNDKAQAKLVRCVSGSIFDVAVDIRHGSPTFGKWFGLELSADNKKMLFIPQGFAHGFLTLSDNTEILYKTDNEYSKEHDSGIAFDDSDFNIQWPKLDIEYILSDKDKNQPSFKEAKNNFTYYK